MFNLTFYYLLSITRIFCIGYLKSNATALILLFENKYFDSLFISLCFVYVVLNMFIFDFHIINFLTILCILSLYSFCYLLV